jgi:hypothetical protein
LGTGGPGFPGPESSGRAALAAPAVVTSIPHVTTVTTTPTGIVNLLFILSFFPSGGYAELTSSSEDEALGSTHPAGRR